MVIHKNIRWFYQAIICFKVLRRFQSVIKQGYNNLGSFCHGLCGRSKVGAHRKKDADVTQDKSLLCYVLVNNTFLKKKLFGGGRRGQCFPSPLLIYLSVVGVPCCAVQLYLCFSCVPLSTLSREQTPVT